MRWDLQTEPRKKRESRDDALSTEHAVRNPLRHGQRLARERGLRSSIAVGRAAGRVRRYRHVWILMGDQIGCFMPPRRIIVSVRGIAWTAACGLKGASASSNSSRATETLCCSSTRTEWVWRNIFVGNLQDPFVGKLHAELLQTVSAHVVHLVEERICSTRVSAAARRVGIERRS